MFLVLPTAETRTLTFTVFAVLRQHVVRFAAAAIMSNRLLHTVVLAAAIADGA